MHCDIKNVHAMRTGTEKTSSGFKMSKPVDVEVIEQDHQAWEDNKTAEQLHFSCVSGLVCQVLKNKFCCQVP